MKLENVSAKYLIGFQRTVKNILYICIKYWVHSRETSGGEVGDFSIVAQKMVLFFCDCSINVDLRFIIVLGIVYITFIIFTINIVSNFFLIFIY